MIRRPALSIFRSGCLALLFCSAPLPALATGCPNGLNGATGNAGDEFHNNTYNVMQYCNGASWVNEGTGGGFGTLTSGDVCSTDGTVINCTTPSFSVPYGGTGNTSFTAHGVLIGEGGSPIAVTSAGAANALLQANGSSSDPAWTSTITGLTFSGGTFSGTTTLPNTGVINGSGNIGVGTATPQSALHVYGGELQVGSSGAGCSSANAGAVRYSSGLMYYCTGSAWNRLASGSCSGSSSGGTDTSLASGLVAYWNFNEDTGTNLYDDTGNGNYGVWEGSTGSQWVTGKIGSALSFDGTNNYVSIALASFSVTSVSVSAWFKTTSNSEVIFETQNNSPLIYMLVGATTAGGTANKLNAYFRPTTGGAVQLANGATTVNDGNWHMGTVVKNTSTQNIYIYVDGNLDSTTADANTASITTSGGVTDIGSQEGLDFFSGTIDEVGVWNVALTSGQVTTLYNSGAGNTFNAFVCAPLVNSSGGFTN
jgi:hypothetical protein